MIDWGTFLMGMYSKYESSSACFVDDFSRLLGSLVIALKFDSSVRSC